VLLEEEMKREEVLVWVSRIRVIERYPLKLPGLVRGSLLEEPLATSSISGVAILCFF